MTTDMESLNHRSAVAAVPQTCLAVSAALHDRDGHVVVAHYGSAAAEIAVCMTSVGLADRSDYGVVELRGDREQVDRALIARFGDPPLASGSGRRIDGIWYLRLDAHRTLLVGPHATLATAAAIAYERDSDHLAHRDIGASLAIIGIVGPRAARLLGAAGLPELPLGAVGGDPGDRSIVAILRESRRRYLVLVRAGAADALWARLLSAGKPLGAAFVGHDALTLLHASAAAAG
jgi:glycine cleavage system aminomethyltransferase T